MLDIRVTAAARRATVALAGLVVLLALVGLSGSGSSLVEEGAYDVVIVASALLCVARAVFVAEQRLAWSFIAAGLTLWMAGDIYFSVAESGVITLYPSVTEAMYVACYPCFAVGMIALARASVKGHTGLLLLDGLTAALATTSIGLALLTGPALEVMAGDETSWAPSIAYPVCDFMLLAFAVGILAMSGRERSPSWVLLAVGWAAAGTADTIYVYDAVAGGYAFGTAYDFLWPLSTLLVAAAAWQPARTPVDSPVRTAPLFALPSLFALAALAVLVYDHFAHVGSPPMFLAAATLLVVIARVGLALRELGASHEAQLRLREESARSQRLEALGQLAGGVAHDFNNLLAVILNYSHCLIRSMPEGDERREDAEEIRRTGELAARLTHQLLLFSRRGTAPPELIDVRHALTELDGVLRTTVTERVQLEVRGEDDLPPVKLGAGQLDQILLNLAVNARDAMPGGGSLSIAAEAVHLEDGASEPCLPAGDYVRLTVADTGGGMSQQVAERAFEPFFSTKPRGQGTGLGLATVYGIAEHAGGTVQLHSRKDAGTSVLVYLPVAPSRRFEPARRSSNVMPAGRGERILLVEDEPALRGSTSRILGAHGYEVIEAADGEEAINLVADLEQGVDLLLTDLVMPRLSGAELAKLMRAEQPDLPVIFVSGYPGEILSSQGLISLPGRTLVKPLKAAELLRACRTALDSKGAARPELAEA